MHGIHTDIYSVLQALPLQSLTLYWLEIETPKLVMIPKGKQLLYTASQMAGCKQGLLSQKRKWLSWGTPCVHTLHHPLGRKQFRKEIGVCITQRNNVSVNLMALNHITKKRLHLNWWEIWPTSQTKTQKGSASSICGAKEMQLPNWSM